MSVRVRFHEPRGELRWHKFFANPIVTCDGEVVGRVTKVCRDRNGWSAEVEWARAFERAELWFMGPGDEVMELELWKKDPPL